MNGLYLGSEDIVRCICTCVDVICGLLDLFAYDAYVWSEVYNYNQFALHSHSHWFYQGKGEWVSVCAFRNIMFRIVEG